ncbi:hypothetical protein M3650_08015 [Paenibacillus sp. MER TA 81-3]|uniref:hypothetical protein n=1 Tax=Paenibacillus sp. MER TA 81-3 TaxID=2939573 RepID=UPI00203E4740|nr:hypothetical protein [Paenibacillus sp. MER TA 81-3]MCM3338580.1 hypothetical protein [Paenibacillus sp. MER TA 81-3]
MQSMAKLLLGQVSDRYGGLMLVLAVTPLIVHSDPLGTLLLPLSIASRGRVHISIPVELASLCLLGCAPNRAAPHTIALQPKASMRACSASLTTCYPVPF